MDSDGGFGEYSRPDHANELVPPTLNPDNLLGGKRKGDRFSKREIEKIARTLQIEMWKFRDRIWPDRRDIVPTDILDPAVVLRLSGYALDIYESLGQYSQGHEIFEVAGTIDEYERCVQVSRRFSREILNFTTAHELGHAILHQGDGLHRDRAQDGGAGGVPRDETEIEADIFAAYFLMPGKLVRNIFGNLFLTDRFVIDEDAAFALGFDSVTLLEKNAGRYVI